MTSASPLSSILLTSLLTPSFFREAVNKDKEFLEIASITPISNCFSDPSNLIDKGLFGSTPAAIRGPSTAPSIICL